MLNVRKDPKKAVLLSLCPGLGFLYLENIKYWLTFFFLTFMPLITIGNVGKSAILISLLLYGLSIYYTYTLANETLKNHDIYKKDPYFVLCLSVILDGLGQFTLKQYKKAYFMMLFGFTSCLIVWVFMIMKFGFVDLLLAAKGTTLFTLTNVMIVWLLISLPVKFLSLVDAYYSTYHLYVARK